MKVYLDWASTTPICEAAKKAIIEHFDDFGNPSSAHELGRNARVLIEDARERIAKCINASPNDIYFTSGGSEANTWALNQFTPISSEIEHHSINTEYHFPVNNDGIVNPKSCLGFHYWITDVISCAYVNNEIGTIQPIKEIIRAAHSEKKYMHIDAVQAIPYLPIDIDYLGCNMLSASGHKFGAPKGIGFLFADEYVGIERLINGGKQEQGLRGGTENVLGIISMAAALEDTIQNMEERNVHIRYLRDKLLDRLLQIPGSHLNGSFEHRVVNNINIRFDGVSGSRLVALCSLYGVYISSGSACNEWVAKPSHVLKAIGLTDEEALSSIRITLGHENTEKEIDIAANIITELVKRIRDEE